MSMLAPKRMISKDAADYIGPLRRGHQTEPCQSCTMFQQPRRCTLVRGPIEPRGHCRYFNRKPAAESGTGHRTT